MADAPADSLAAWARRHGVPDAAVDELRTVLQPGPMSGADLFTLAPAAPSPVVADLGHSHLDLGERLGAGGMGEVHRAFDARLQRDVAVKALHPRHAHSAAHRSWFVDEARAQAQLAHPGVIPVHELGTLGDGRPYFTMEINRGRTLRALVAERAGEPLRRLIDVLHRACGIVAYAHSRGVVHRDLKPANLMVGAFGEVHVIDWGLVQPDGADAPAAGTPAYMAPEQRAGDPADPRVDVFALGRILHELAPDHPELGPIAARATAAAPPDRYADAGELTEALAEWLDGSARRARALEVLRRAEPLLPEAQAYRERADAHDATATELAIQIPPCAPVDDKAALWHAQDEAERCRRAAAAAERSRVDLLVQALSHDPELPEAQRHLAAWYRDQLLTAEAQRDPAAAEAAEARLRYYDDGQHAAFLEGTGAVTVHTDPPGAEVRLHRLELVRRRLQPRFERVLGTTPLDAAPVPRGSWLITVHREGHDDVAYPVALDREEHWHGIPPGATAPHPVWLPPHGHLGPDDCYVPAGWFRFGDDDAPHQAWPAERRWLGSFVMRRFPVTNAEYLRFLDALVAAGRDSDAARCVPRAQRAQVDDRIDPVYARRADGTHHLVPDGDGDLWLPDWPVVQVDWRSARTYAEWISAPAEAPWRLPDEAEWEKAARGVDGRAFPWGDRFDATFALVRTSFPDRPTLAPVTDFPSDESVYGVRGMAGGVRDWCAPRYARPGVAPPPDHEPGDRLLRGGCWHFSSGAARLTARARFYEGRVSDLAGFRLCRSVPTPEET